MSALIFFAVIIALGFFAIFIACCYRRYKDEVLGTRRRDAINSGIPISGTTPLQTENGFEDDRWSINDFSNRRQTNSRAPYPTSDSVTNMPVPSFSPQPPYPTSNATSMPLPSFSGSSNVTSVQNTPLLISTTITPTVVPSNTDDPPPSYSEAMRSTSK